ncbi:MAG TPA: sugar transferase [Chitinophagales bacterium]|nr:sugar transferase [Chitinophagales bacterium]
MKRLFDIVLTLTALVVLFPILLLIGMLVVLDSKGPMIYKQQRIGKNEKPFWLFKFRTMKHHSDKQGLLTIGERDPRITRLGYFLRKSKLDELPQLWNVLTGDMSIVGPRPEVKKYVDMYDDRQRRVLDVRPGLTDPASLEYIDENKILESFDHPEEAYIKMIMPRKLELNLDYIERRNFFFDLFIMVRTLMRIVMPR